MTKPVIATCENVLSICKVKPQSVDNKTLAWEVKDVAKGCGKSMNVTRYKYNGN